MNWKPITPKTVFPKDRTFILYDKNATSGLCIYEAMWFKKGTLQCPATHENYYPKDFSHWSEMPHLPTTKQKCPKCKRGW